MTSIVFPENSVTDLINAGLTARHYTMKSKEVRIFAIKETEKDVFWNNIQGYVDEESHSLVILNLPLPSEEALRNLDLRPYQQSIIHVPSKFMIITPQSRRILLEKGIVSMPQRPPYKCFPGEYTDHVEKRWMKIGKILSFGNELGSLSERRIVRGLLKQMERNPELVIQRIAENDVDFFEAVGEGPLPKISRQIVKPDCEIVSAEGTTSELIPVAFDHFLDSGKTPLGIKGTEDHLILTKSPTFASSIVNRCGLVTKSEKKFGKGAIMVLQKKDDLDIGLLMGRISQKTVFIRFGKPRFAVKKTLMRRIVGGLGPKGRSYRGISEEYPGIEIKKDIIVAPRDAVEDIIDSLRETGTEFEIII